MKELYVGNAEVFKLGNTEKVGAILTINLEDLATYISEDDDNQDEIKLKVFPLKPENVTKHKTHSIKYLNNDKKT